ncbi:MAG: bifunctional phosphoribosylaminoimidazolecarboxamide formyltransferase/IMP cyclohydrolase [Balneolaceae bacterium]|nr:bifunctional phosphoribosylaminoimidazolecarboxamide formyltransferase/IMP cyclohydrolase [Balneolaceae bacterium]MCH8547276.1 bifunctional phosphoribosylaminoimidazolecarboxamide formyltransferase/IMP cyclohydrolase [Balneolaceae bacterium]
MSLKPLSSLPNTPLKVKRALISVSDKSGITELASALHNAGVELISTGGTAKAIKEAGLPVKDVSEITGFPECLDGRVKTLHPKVHGGVLARTSHQPDLDELKKLEISPIEMVVVNLYPFKETVSSPDVTPAVATENIDIGGPTMIRAAAKNFAHVAVVTSPDQYRNVTKEITDAGEISFSTRRMLARKAFQHTADYDAAISNYFNEMEDLATPDQLILSLPKSADLRYGENPHQLAAVYGNQSEMIDCFHGKELSYNNYLDIDAALQLIAEFRDDDPTTAIFKHTVPCGVATADALADSYHKAFATDKVSPFGGIIIVNRPLDMETAEAIDEIFTEIILAPEYEDGVAEFLKKKKNRRLIRVLRLPEATGELQIKTIFGGAAVQQADTGSLLNSSQNMVTKREPTEQELADLLFAWKIVKHVKSNAIVYAKDRSTVGIGTGQTSRVDSSEIAVSKAAKEGLSLKGSVVASDAFFPFADGITAAAKAGATAAIQPGGSIRDEEVIENADKHNMAMIFTGMRHFRH